MIEPANARSPVVDVDDQGSWPPPIARSVDRWTSQIATTPRSACDLRLPAEEQQAFRGLFAGHWVRGFHCTNLLPHEATGIRRCGLRPLTRELLDARIADAFHHGHLDVLERDLFARAHLFADPSLVNEIEGRVGQVCAILSSRPLRDQPYMANDLLDTWGGEGLVTALGWGSPAAESLRWRGRPSIVVVLLDLGSHPGRDEVSPDLLEIFVGARLGCADIAADVFYRSPIPAECIEAIWQPGDWQYDRFAGLPRPPAPPRPTRDR